jgi:hypothetical protein
MEKVLGVASLHQERCHQPEQCLASQQQCPVKAVGVVDANLSQ